MIRLSCILDVSSRAPYAYLSGLVVAIKQANERLTLQEQNGQSIHFHGTLNGPASLLNS